MAITSSATKKIASERLPVLDHFSRIPAAMFGIVMRHLHYSDYHAIERTSRSAPRLYAVDLLRNCSPTTYDEFEGIVQLLRDKGITLPGVDLNRVSIDVVGIINFIGTRNLRSIDLSTFPFPHFKGYLKTDVGYAFFCANFDSLDVSSDRAWELVEAVKEDKRAMFAAHICKIYISKFCNAPELSLFHTIHSVEHIITRFGERGAPSDLAYQVAVHYVSKCLSPGRALSSLNVIVARANGDTAADRTLRATFGPIFNDPNKMIALASKALDAHECWRQISDDVDEIDDANNIPMIDVSFSHSRVDKENGIIEIDKAFSISDPVGYHAGKILNALLASRACQHPFYMDRFLLRLETAGESALTVEAIMNFHTETAGEFQYLQSRVAAAAAIVNPSAAAAAVVHPGMPPITRLASLPPPATRNV